MLLRIGLESVQVHGRHRDEDGRASRDLRFRLENDFMHFLQHGRPFRSVHSPEMEIESNVSGGFDLPIRAFVAKECVVVRWETLARKSNRLQVRDGRFVIPCGDDVDVAESPPGDGSVQPT